MAERRGTKGAVWGASIGIATAALTFGLPAAAHISLENGGTHKSRYGDDEIKAGPCGRTAGTRGTNVYTYAPGQKITVSLIETIPHPGYYRFAFDNDGDDAFIEPRSIKAIDPARKCPISPADKCGMSDFYNSPAVLPGMDNLNPHCAAPCADAGPIVAGNTKFTWEVTLPNVECTNCTLQVIQVMEDDFAHGPYDPTPGVGIEDIYHQCIDIILKRPDDGGTGTADAGRPDGSGTTGTGGAGGAAGAGGSGTGGATTGTGGSGTGGATTGAGGSGTGGTSTTGGAGGTTGSGGATTGTGGATTGSTGGTNVTGGSGGASTGTGTAGSGTAGSGTAGSGTAGASGPVGDDDGGGCSVSGRAGSTSAFAGWSVLALALVSRRRRR